MAEKQRREEVKARREANRKAAQVVQKVRAKAALMLRRVMALTDHAQITNPKKLSKLSKKQASKLVNV